MYDCIIQLAEELKKSVIFLCHIEILEEFRKCTKPESFSMLLKSRPNFSDAKGYLYALQLLKQNKDNENIPSFLKDQINEILNYENLNKFEESCKVVGNFLDEFFVEIIGISSNTSEILQKMSPSGRRTVMELRSILHRKGLIRGLFNYIGFYNGSTPKEGSLLEEMVRNDRYFFPLKRDYRKLINQMYDNDLEKKKYLMFHLSFMTFQRIYIDLLYDLIIESVPIITTDVFSNLKVKSLNEINIFCGISSSIETFLPDINFYLFSSGNNKIEQLLISKSKKISFDKDNQNVLLKGFMINSNFYIK